MATADRRPRRTMVWLVLDRNSVATAFWYRDTAVSYARAWDASRSERAPHRVIRVVELRPGERVIESPRGRGKRGRKM